MVNKKVEWEHPRLGNGPDKCPGCGRFTYTFGLPLPGQPAPRHGEYDSRERDKRVCDACKRLWISGRPSKTVIEGWEKRGYKIVTIYDFE